MNKNGARTVDARVRLQDELKAVREEGPLVEHGADPDEWQMAVDGLGDRVDLGNEFELFWASCVHGEDLPAPGEAAQVKTNWAAWIKDAKKLAAELAESRRLTERAGVAPDQPDEPLESDPEMGTEAKFAYLVADRALDFAEEDLPDHVLRTLALGYPIIFQYAPETLDIGVWQAMNAMARMGYLTRIAEAVLLEDQAFLGDAEVSELLAPYLDPSGETPGERWAECAQHFAQAEPVFQPPDGSLIRTVLGQSAEWRMECAYRTIEPIAVPTDDLNFLESEAYADDQQPKVLEGDEVRRCWLYGFFLRVVQESVHRAGGEITPL